MCVSNPRVSKTAREKQVPNIIDYMFYDNNKGKRSKRKRIWGCKGKRTDRCGVNSNKLQFCKFGGKMNIKISLALSIAFSKQLHRSLHQKWNNKIIDKLRNAQFWKGSSQLGLLKYYEFWKQFILCINSV